MALSDGERAALILRLRQRTDPCHRYWKDMATPTQREVAQSSARYRLIWASNRAGKSAHAAWEVASAARRIHPTRSTSINGVYVIFAPFRAQINDPWYKKLRVNCELVGDCQGMPFVPDHELAIENGGLAEYFTYGAGEKTVKAIKLANGNKIAFVPSAGKHVWKTIEGMGMILGIAIDEAAGNEKLLTECGVRLLDANSHPKVKQDCGGGWLLWVATETKLNNTFIDLKEKCLNQDPMYADYRAFNLPPHENPAIDMKEREKLRTLMSAEEYKIRMEGTASAGDTMQLWPQFGAHNILKQDYEPTPRDNLWFGYDPGTNYAGGVLCAIRPEEPKKLIAIKCWQWHRMTIEGQMADLREYLQGRFLCGFVYDQAARIVNPTGQSVIGRLFKILQSERYHIRILRGLLKGRSNYEDTVPIMRHYFESGNFAMNISTASGGQVLKHQITSQRFKENAHELKESNISEGNDHEGDSCRYLMSLRPVYAAYQLNPKLWGPGTGGHDPQEAFAAQDHRVLSEEGIKHAELLARGANVGRRRRLALIGRSRQRA